jgi:hypothetical protein
MKIIQRKIKKSDLVRRWVCYVARSGYSPSSYCTPDDPHEGRWNCGYRHEFSLSLTDAEMEAWK